MAELGVIFDMDGVLVDSYEAHFLSWCELAVMLTACEVPGIYVQPDTGTLCVFDHVDARIVEQEENSVVLEIINPTAYDAEITVLSESSSRMIEPLRRDLYLHLPRVTLKSGETRRVRFDG